MKKWPDKALFCAAWAWLKLFLAILQFCSKNMQIQTITIALCIYSDLPYIGKYKEKQLFDAHNFFFFFECPSVKNDNFNASK